MIDIPALWRRIARKLRGESGVPSLARRYPDREIGRGSYGNVEISEFGNDAGLSSGAYCSFAEGVVIMLGGEHRPDWVTTFPFNALDPRFRHIEGHPASRGDVRIGNDVWIGREALILSGVTIGDGAVIGARAVVAKDVPPYAIAVGNPARVVRHRFDEGTVGRLLAVKWWDWNEARIARAIPAMLDTDIGDFLTQVEEGRL